MKNVGNTPAYGVTTTCQMTLVRAPFSDFPLDAISTTEYQTGTIYPGVYSFMLNLHYATDRGFFQYAGRRGRSWKLMGSRFAHPLVLDGGDFS
jgi:hypothetical protein